MAWETRKRGGSYYTRSRRVKGRVVREYVGTGGTAEVCAMIDAIATADRRDEARAWRETRARLTTAEKAVALLCRASDVQVAAALTASGYHRHHRGEWRKARNATTQA